MKIPQILTLIQVYFFTIDIKRQPNDSRCWLASVFSQIYIYRYHELQWFLLQVRIDTGLHLHSLSHKREGS